MSDPQQSAEGFDPTRERPQDREAREAQEQRDARGERRAQPPGEGPTGPGSDQQGAVDDGRGGHRQGDRSDRGN